MFILYAIPIGLVLGFLLGGRLEGLAAVRFRFAPLVVAVLLLQLALFSPLADAVPDDLSRLVYVVSTGLVVFVLLGNLRVTGIPLIVLGASSNLLAIVANGGAMPASQAALDALGFGVGGNTNSVVVANPAFEPLTDIFAMPRWMPFANIFSIGDVIIGAGVAIAIAAAMRGRPERARPE